MSQLLGNIQLWSSLPAFIIYYLFYTAFDSKNPEGRVKDTKVKLAQFSIEINKNEFVKCIEGI